MAKKKITLEEKLEEAIVKDIPYDVPENWVWIKFGTVCKLNNGYAFKSTEYKESGVPILRISNIQEFGINFDEKTVYSEYDENLDRYYVNQGDLLIAMSGATTGKTGVYTEKEKSYLNQRVGNIKIERPQLITDKFRNYIVNYKSKEILDLAYGGAQPNISTSMIEGLSIPLPPLKEQQRIIDKIESLFQKLDKAKELIEEAREDFEKRKFSIIYKGIAGDLTRNKSKMKTKNGIRIPDTWKWIEFKKLGKLERGRSKHRPRNDQRLFGGEYPFIQTGDIANSDVYVIEHKQTLSEFGLNQSRLFEKGTLCITIAANIGDVAILTYDCCFPDSVVGFTPNENVDSKYIYYFLTLIKRDLEHFAPATAQKNINLKILGDVEIPTPSLEEQKEIVRILDKILEKEKRVEELNALEEQIELIKKSILAKAFRGQIRTNCEEDESALELLKEVLSKE